MLFRSAAAALGDGRVGGVLDTWLTPLKKLKREHKAELETITDAGARAQRLAELNVAAGIETLLSNIVVEDAVNERGLQVHGVLFDIPSGKLRDLECGNCKPMEQIDDDVPGHEAEKVAAEKAEAEAAQRIQA